MARNSASHEIIPILMIVVIICFAIIEFHHIIPQPYYTTTSSNYYIASELEKCIDRCRKNFPEHTITLTFCITRCYDHYGVN
ncbi:uncharacterized protein DS421_12g353840 [Arachis hypogaea]|nr:uncharacterized protein DS421_12g353840 [Arachis hypogaea]